MTAPDLQQTKVLHEAMPFAAVLGAEALPSERGEVRARVLWQPDRCTSGDALHGGVIMGLADTCGGACAFANLPQGAVGTTTIESKTNFFRGVRSGSIEAAARPLHIGRTTVVVETDVFDDARKRVARVTQTQAVLYPKG